MPNTKIVDKVERESERERWEREAIKKCYVEFQLDEHVACVVCFHSQKPNDRTKKNKEETRERERKIVSSQRYVNKLLLY